MTAPARDRGPVVVPVGRASVAVPEPVARALGEYLAHLSVERGMSEHTVAAYRRDLTRYGAYLGARGRDSR
ncbi:MAG: site-specific integrase, partial [Georgenia sp.]